MNLHRHKTYHITVKAVIVNEGKALILKALSKNGLSVYELPGGRIDEGESIRLCLKRELEEELGITKFKMGKIIGAYERSEYKKEGIDGAMALIYEVFIEELILNLSDEHTEYEWITKEDLQRIVGNGENIDVGIVKTLTRVL